MKPKKETMKEMRKRRKKNGLKVFRCEADEKLTIRLENTAQEYYMSLSIKDLLEFEAKF